LNNFVFCSTGTMIGRVTGYNYNLIVENMKNISCDGFELIILPAWYDKLDEVSSALVKGNVYIPVLHIEKEIGYLVSRNEDGDMAEALRLFEENCRVAHNVGAEKCVFHLWGNAPSDSHIEHNVEVFPRFLEIADKYGLILTVENIPCTTHDPISNWDRLIRYTPDVKFTLDTRFAAFHNQIETVFERRELFEHIIHVHISDFGGNRMEWGKIRPILHPGEGVIDFDKFFDNLKFYENSITLESPVMSESGIDIDKLNRTLGYIKSKVKP